MARVNLVEEFYQPLLQSLGYEIGNEGIVKLDGKVMSVADKVLALPTDDNLKNMNPERVLFHPLSENIARSESPMYKFLRASVIHRVNTDIMAVARMLLLVANDAEMESRLTAEQLQVLLPCNNVSEKTIKALTKAEANMNITDNAVYSVYNRRNGTIGSDSFNRVAAVTFPLINALIEGNPKHEFWVDLKIRKADYPTFIGLFEAVLPNVFEDNAYSAGSDAMDAPSFYALVLAYLKIQERLATMVTLFSSLAEFGAISTYMEFLPTVRAAMNDFKRFNKLIPDLEGNIGDVASNDPSRRQTKIPVGVGPSDLSNQLQARTANIAMNQPATPTHAPVVNQPVHAPTQSTAPVHAPVKNASSDFNTDFNLNQVMNPNQPQGFNGNITQTPQYQALLHQAQSPDPVARQAAINQMNAMSGQQQQNAQLYFNNQQQQFGGFGQQQQMYAGQQFGGQQQFGNQMYGGQQFGGQMYGGQPVMSREQQLLELMKSSDKIVAFNASTEYHQLMSNRPQQGWITQGQQFGGQPQQPMFGGQQYGGQMYGGQQFGGFGGQMTFKTK